MNQPEKGWHEMSAWWNWRTLKVLQDPMSPPPCASPLGSPTTPSMNSLSGTLTSIPVSYSTSCLGRSQAEGGDVSCYLVEMTSVLGFSPQKGSLQRSMRIPISSILYLKFLPVLSSKNKVDEEPLCIRGHYQEKKKKQPTEYPIKD